MTAVAVVLVVIVVESARPGWRRRFEPGITRLPRSIEPTRYDVQASFVNRTCPCDLPNPFRAARMNLALPKLTDSLALTTQNPTHTWAKFSYALSVSESLPKLSKLQAQVLNSF